MRFKTAIVLSVVCGLVVFAACDRKTRELARKEKPIGAPEYTAQENVASPPGLANVKAVAPHGKGPDGASIFNANCAACHQTTGQGVPGAFPPLVGSPYVTGPNVERMASILLYGLQGPIHVNGQLYNSVMAPWGDKFTNEELAAVATYVRSSWGNKADPVAPDVFAKARAKWGTRAMFTIQELGEEN